MSGIVGTYRFDSRPLNRGTLVDMLETLRHRGPDGSKIWHQDHVGLGQSALHTTPESVQEVLPLVDQTAGLALTADARIDNRDELISQLGLSDSRSESTPDSRLILAAYEKWGEECPERLIGDFAFAVWDERQRRLFCARDPMGIKPLYYHHSSRGFFFASEIKALLCLQEVPRRLNELKVADFLVPIFTDQVSTYYEDIYRLPPAHSMTVNDRGLRTRSYWSLDPTRELRLGSGEEYVEAFRELFTEAVRCRLRSAFPVGSTLSGGLDSSSIACTAGRLMVSEGSRRLHTFSAIFPTLAKEDPRIDERHYIETVLDLNLFEEHFIHADRCKPLADVSWHKDEAWPAPGLWLNRGIFRSAHSHDVRVVLSGFGGDDVVSHGYEYLEELARTGRWSDFAREAAALAERTGRTSEFYFSYFGKENLTNLARERHWGAFMKQSSEIAEHFRLSRSHLLLNAALKPLAPIQVRWLWRWLSGGPRPETPTVCLNRAINANFAEQTGLTQRIQEIDDRESSDATSIREGMAGALLDGRLEFPLSVFDHTAATFSLEPRYPFFDRRLMDFCLAVGFEHKLGEGWTRAVLRRAMQDTLPPAVQWRTTKGNLSLNVRRRLLLERKMLDELILDDPGIIEAYIDIPALRAAYERYLERPGAASESDLFTVFLAANLGLWLRQSGLGTFE